MDESVKIKSITIRNYKNIESIEILNPGALNVFYSPEIDHSFFCCEILEAIEFAVIAENRGFLEAVKAKDPFRTLGKKKSLEIAFTFETPYENKPQKNIISYYKIKASSLYNRSINMRGANIGLALNSISTTRFYYKGLFEKYKKEQKNVFCFFYSHEDLMRITPENVFMFYHSKNGQKIVQRDKL